MKPLEFIFYIIAHFIQLEPGRLAKLKEEAAMWETDQIEKGGYLANILKYSNAWYVQVILAVSLIFAVKSISNWLVSSPEIDSEDDQDESPIFNSKNKKFVIQN